MSTITIPVDPVGANLFRTGSQELRDDIVNLVAKRLLEEQQLLSKADFERLMKDTVRNTFFPGEDRSELERTAAKEQLSRTMDRMAAQAAANGLTPEIFEEILRDE